MISSNPNTNPYKLLSIVQSYAPNADAHQKAADKYNEVVKEAQSEDEATRWMTWVLHDGLSYGNWPWMDHKGISAKI